MTGILTVTALLMGVIPMTQAKENKADSKRKYAAPSKKIEAAVDAGKLTKEEAKEKMAAMKKEGRSKKKQQRRK